MKFYFFSHYISSRHQDFFDVKILVFTLKSNNITAIIQIYEKASVSLFLPFISPY